MSRENSFSVSRAVFMVSPWFIVSMTRYVLHDKKRLQHDLSPEPLCFLVIYWVASAYDVYSLSLLYRCPSTSLSHARALGRFQRVGASLSSSKCPVNAWCVSDTYSATRRCYD